MKNNSKNPEVLRHALLSVLAAMSVYYEDEVDMPCDRLKSIAVQVNEKFNLNIDINAIFMDKEEIELDESCLHDEDENYFDSDFGRL